MGCDWAWLICVWWVFSKAVVCCSQITISCWASRYWYSGTRGDWLGETTGYSWSDHSPELSADTSDISSVKADPRSRLMSSIHDSKSLSSELTSDCTQSIMLSQSPDRSVTGEEMSSEMPSHSTTVSARTLRSSLSSNPNLAGFTPLRSVPGHVTQCREFYYSSRCHVKGVELTEHNYDTRSEVLKTLVNHWRYWKVWKDIEQCPHVCLLIRVKTNVVLESLTLHSAIIF